MVIPYLADPLQAIIFCFAGRLFYPPARHPSPLSSFARLRPPLQLRYLISHSHTYPEPLLSQ
jgi:hypothetical protein